MSDNTDTNIDTEPVLTTMFSAGHRVRTHPATDHWMRGERFGVVEKVGRTRVHVRMDASGRVHRLHPHDLIPVEC